MSNSPRYVRTHPRTRQLLLLIALAEEDNIHRTVAAFNMTQPAASKLLHELEAMLDMQPFEHMSRDMRPTHYGDTLIRHVRAIVGSLDQAQEEVLRLKVGHLRHMAVGIITLPGVRLLPSVVVRITREHPRLRVSLEIESSNVLLERLAQDKFDLAVDRLFAERDKLHLRYEPLADEPVVAVAWPGRPLLPEPSPTLADVQTVTQVVPPIDSMLHHRFGLIFQ